MEKKKHIGFEIRWIQNMIGEKMKEREEKDGVCITQLQHWILHYIAHSDRDIYQRDLEEAFHVSRATISNTLQTMERNGLIIRTAVQQDARLKKLSLTDKAREFQRKGKERVEAMEASLTKGFREEEKELLYELLKRVRCNLEEEE